VKYPPVSILSLSGGRQDPLSLTALDSEDASFSSVLDMRPRMDSGATPRGGVVKKLLTRLLISFQTTSNTKDRRGLR
jgi:hypothetical protein